MRIDFAIELDDPGLRRFRDAWRRACARQGDGPIDRLAEDALGTQAALASDTAPVHLARLRAIPRVVELLTAPGWPLPASEREALGGALRYFCDRHDLIPDDEPRFGLLDDVIVLEMALAACRHSWLAWGEYRDWLESHPDAVPQDRDGWRRTRESLLRDALRRPRLGSYLDVPTRPAYVPAAPGVDFPEAVQFGLH